MQKLALPLDTAGFGAAELLEHMKFDKKNTGGQIRFVLLEKPGKPVFGIPITAEEFENAWSAQKRLFG
ncbi:MAG TPA: 3-dehydroquinate synthase, partial [Leptospiraceae bacterium]|nr:3-dehydroquinate synthase [Leptospiraceae bacterium]